MRFAGNTPGSVLIRDALIKERRGGLAALRARALRGDDRGEKSGGEAGDDLVNAGALEESNAFVIFLRFSFSSSVKI